MHYATVVCTEWFCIFLMYTFICMLCLNDVPLIFCACNALPLNYMGYESDGNSMLATGGVYISVKCDISDFCC